MPTVPDITREQLTQPQPPPPWRRTLITLATRPAQPTPPPQLTTQWAPSRLLSPPAALPQTSREPLTTSAEIPGSSPHSEPTASTTRWSPPHSNRRHIYQSITGMDEIRF